MHNFFVFLVCTFADFNFALIVVRQIQTACKALFVRYHLREFARKLSLKLNYFVSLFIGLSCD